MNLSKPTASTPKNHILSVDVEDYFQVEAFADSVPPSSWDLWPSRVVGNTHKVLDLLDQHEAKATFFFVGWIAERFPTLVREVAHRGHEIACHSYWHRPVYSLKPQQFREDTRIAKQAIEQAGSVRVLGYRAPTWSITKECLWALDVLAEEGFVYDSSIYPIWHDLYGIPTAKRFAYEYSCQNGLRLREYPPATIRLATLNFPAAGGGYLRLFPLLFTRWAFQRIAKECQEPVVVYFHPWELDPGQPRIRGKLRSRFRHYVNLNRMEMRLSYLLDHYSFYAFRETLGHDQRSQQWERARHQDKSQIHFGLREEPSDY